MAKQVKPSKRGELEITSVNEKFLKLNKLKLELLGRGFAWLDTGNHDSLMEAGKFVQTIEHRQGLKVSCLEEIAFQNGWLSRKFLLKKANALNKTSYGEYLFKIANESE